jgi:RHS repeat-associated protein
MFGSKRLCLISFVIIFSLFINFLFVSVSKADSLGISGPSQMSAGQTQSMTASGGSGSYSWGMASGGASLSGTTGSSVNVTVPANMSTNYYCNSNPTICVVDSEGQKACMQIIVNAYSDMSKPAYSIRSEGPFTCPQCWDFNWTATCSLGYTDQDYNCIGTKLRLYGYQISNHFCGNYSPYASGPTCSQACDCGGCHAESLALISPPIGSIIDERTDAMKAQGCCSPGLAGGGAGGAGGTGGMGSDSGTCGGGSGGGNGSGGGSPSSSSDSSSTNSKGDSLYNLKSGNLYHSQDVAGLTFSYNSIDIYSDYIRPLGSKWTYNYDLRLEALSDNATLILKEGDGNIIYFRLSGSIYYPDAISGDTSQIVKNSNGTYTRTAKNGTIYAFNSIGRLLSISDRNGNTTTLTYSGSYANGTSITDKNGRITTLTPDSNGKITGVTDPAGRTYTIAYSGSLITSITDPLGNTWLYTYDANGRMLTKKDPANDTVTYTYDPSTGNLLTSTDPEGKVRTINYNQSGTSTVTEKDGGVWTYTYDPTYAVKTAKTDPLGNTTQYKYDLKRNLTSTIAPDGSITRYTYDGNSNMTSVTDPLGKTTTYTYNSLNLVTSITDPKGHITQYGYDAKGNLTSVTDAANATTQYQYDAKGNLTAIINPLGKTTSMTYDQHNNLIIVTDPKSGTVTMAYDNIGNMTRQTDALGNVTTFQYNALNQMTQITDPLSNITHYTYDYNGNKLSSTDANSNTTQYVYDYKSKLTQITDALNNITNMTYGQTGCSSCGSGVDKLTALTDAKNQTTAYQYYQTGKLLQETDPQGNITTYTYDSKGNMITRTSPDNKTITFAYDLNNRLTQKTYSDNTNTVFQYDNAGNMTYAGNQNSAYNFTYDADNRITQITDSNGRTISYQYDAAGNRTAMTRPDGQTIAYTYDFNNLLIQIATDLGAYTFGYDANNRRTTRTLPNGTTAAYSYDQDSRHTGIQTTKGATTIDSVIYTYDNAGNRITKAQSPVNYNYTYDTIYRLTQATPSSGSQETYTYDQVGNRLTKAPDTPPSINETTQYSYDDENRLTGVQVTRNNKIKQLSFTYDPFGRRISKTIVQDQIGTDCQSPNVCPRTISYVYDGQNIIMEYDQSGNIIAKYTHGPNIDEPLAVQQSANTYYYHADGLGSITGLSNSSGSIVQTYSYDSFGNMTATGNIRQPFTYTGREYDHATEMYFYRARYYDPKVGRFVTKDPIGFDGGDVNLYAYVSNDPINWIDPDGLSSLVYNSSDGTLTIYSKQGCKVKQCKAGNNTTRKSKGPWPVGNYNYLYHVPHPESGPSGRYGSCGNFVFDVPGRPGIGVHSGRSGPQSRTEGCIRTTDECTKTMLNLNSTDPLTNITVQ